MVVKGIIDGLTEIINFMQREDIQYFVRSVVDTFPFKLGNILVFILSFCIFYSTLADECRELGRSFRTLILINLTITILAASICSGVCYVLGGIWTCGYGLFIGLVAGVMVKGTGKWQSLFPPIGLVSGS